MVAMPPYNQLDQQIQNLLSKGCNPSQVLQQLKTEYSDQSKEAAEILKRIQEIERQTRKKKK